MRYKFNKYAIKVSVENLNTFRIQGTVCCAQQGPEFHSPFAELILSFSYFHCLETL